MMTGKSITEYLYDYTLGLYGGNKRLLARHLQVDHLELYKWIRRLHEGGLSATAIEALLKMCARENISLDKALLGYWEHMETSNIWINSNPCVCANDGFVQRVHSVLESMEIAKPQSDDKHVLARLASDFMAHLERMFCDKTRSASCIFCAAGCCTCPCRNFGVFFDWLVKAIDEQSPNISSFNTPPCEHTLE